MVTKQNNHYLINGAPSYRKDDVLIHPQCNTRTLTPHLGVIVQLIYKAATVILDPLKSNIVSSKGRIHYDKAVYYKSSK